MSSLFHEAERQLSKLGLAALEKEDLDVVVGGLGLGYTAAAALEDTRVRSLVVIEYLAPVIEWHRNGVVPLGETLTGDQRCRLTQADFFALSRDVENSFDPENPEKKTRCHPSGRRSRANQRIAPDERPVLHRGGIEGTCPALETRWGIRSLGGRRTRSLLCRPLGRGFRMGRGPYHRVRQPHYRGQFEGCRLRCQKLPVEKGNRPEKRKLKTDYLLSGSSRMVMFLNLTGAPCPQKQR